MTILPNDDAYGVFGFAQDSLSTILEETQTTPTAANGTYVSSWYQVVREGMSLAGIQW